MNLGRTIEEMTNETTHSDRPFTGQPHTVNGERGKTEVKGLSFRDLADCVVKAFIDSAGFTLENADEMRERANDGTLNYSDLYMLDLGQMDPIAVVQNISCRVEKAMGIYPNVQTC